MGFHIFYMNMFFLCLRHWKQNVQFIQITPFKVGQISPVSLNTGVLVTHFHSLVVAVSVVADSSRETALFQCCGFCWLCMWLFEVIVCLWCVMIWSSLYVCDVCVTIYGYLCCLPVMRMALFGSGMHPAAVCSWCTSWARARCLVSQTTRSSHQVQRRRSGHHLGRLDIFWEIMTGTRSGIIHTNKWHKIDVSAYLQ